MQQAGNRKGSDLNKLTGMVWQACTAAKKMAPDNKTAMCKRLTQIASGVKDAINEVPLFWASCCDSATSLSTICADDTDCALRGLAQTR